MRPLRTAAGLLAALSVAGCGEEPTSSPDVTPAELIADPAPLARMTAEQYTNTIRDLFAPIQFQPLRMPGEIRGSGGFENNAAFNVATPGLIEAYQRTAVIVADRIRDELPTLTGCPRMDAACTRTWLTSFSERAWRRPLTEAESQSVMGDFDRWNSAHGTEIAVTLSVQSLLQSPQFLYFPRFGADAPQEGEGVVALDAWELASRLSYFLWNSMPDEALFEKARDGSILERQILADEAFRMLADGRAVDMVVSFHRQNWDFDEAGSNPIDLEFYAPVFESRDLFAEDDKSDYYYLEYSPQLRHESDVFVAQHLFYGDGRLHTLLTSNQAWVTSEVAEVAYETSVDPNLEPVLWTGVVPGEGNDVLVSFGADYYPVTLDASRRAGYFTMAGFLAGKAGPQQPAPVRRGDMILSRLLCTELTVPGDVPPLENVESQEPKTNRDKYAIHSQSAACAGCHDSIDGIGLTFENYDAMGRWRDTDNGYPVDATGQLLGTDQDGPVNNAVELMNKMADSRTVHDCYTRQWFRYAFGRNETADDEPMIEALQQGFWDADGNVIELIVNLAGSYPFRHRRAQG
jgi:hypothetical protein